MLLSEKDSVVYPRCLAPELRSLPLPAQRAPRRRTTWARVRRRSTKRIREIVAIAKDDGYTHVFAGYGFMAEDAEFVEAIEHAGLGFMGPSSHVAAPRRRQGRGEEARARASATPVIPGVDDVARARWSRRRKDRKGLEKLAKEHELAFAWNAKVSLEDNAEALLQAGYARSVELVTIADLQKEADRICARDLAPSTRPTASASSTSAAAAARASASWRSRTRSRTAVMDVCAESKVVEPGSNRNFLVELNIERTRHNEIQLIGNGDWCLSLGGRDCSVQMHEQKLVEVSLTKELLDVEIERATRQDARDADRRPRLLSRAWRPRARTFGAATGLDSVSTFECIVDGFDFFFMEMNTRIQVEHVVTELVYRLRVHESATIRARRFHVERLIEAMALLAAARQARAEAGARVAPRLRPRGARERDEPRAAAARRRADPQLVARRSPARSASTRASASAIPTRARSSTTTSPAPTTRTSRSCSRTAARGARTTTAWRRSCAAWSCAATICRPTSRSTTG